MASRKRSYANCDYAVLSLQDRAKEWAKGSSAPGTGPSASKLLLSKPLANLG